MELGTLLSLLGDSKATNLIGLVTAIATIVYVAFTYKIYQANAAMVNSLLRQMKEDQRPVLTASVEIRSRAVVVLVIRNRGKSLATNVRISLDRDFYRFGEKSPQNNLRNFTVFNEAISCIAPGDNLRFDLAQGFVIFQERDEDITPRLFKISFEYEWGETKFSEHQWIDLNPYLKASYPASEEVEELERIRKALESLGRH